MHLINTLLNFLQKDMHDVLDQLIGPLSTHINVILSQPISGTDDQRAHIETKKAYLALLNNIIASQLQRIFISERVYVLFYPHFPLKNFYRKFGTL